MYKIEMMENYTIVHYRLNRLEISQVSDFQEILCGQINVTQKAVIFDLSNVEFMDSSGLGAILAILRSLHTKAKLLLCGVSINIKSLLKVTDLDKFLTIYKDLNAAIQASECPSPTDPFLQTQYAALTA